MSSKKKPKILAEKIADLLAPQRLFDPEVDSEDETAPKLVDFDLEETSANEVTTLSAIRKQNVKLLHSVDQKYKGKLSSRADLEHFSGDSEHDEDDEDDFDANGRQMNGDGSLKFRDDDDGDESSVDDAESADEDELKSFSAQLKEENGNDGQNDSPIASDQSVNGSPSFNETVEEEEDEEGVEETDNEDDETDEDSSDEDESDFDADILYADELNGQPPVDKLTESSRILPKAKSQDQFKKGKAVQNQLQMWEKLLEIRIHSQKMLIKANSFPTQTKFETIAEQSPEFSDLAGETEQNVNNLLTNMCELQNLLLKQFSETREFATTRKRSSTNADKIDDHEANSPKKHCRFSNDLTNSFNQFTDYRNSVISKWHDRTKVLAPGKKSQQQTDFDVLRKIEGVLNNKPELVRKSQMIKGGYELFDSDDGIRESTKSNEETVEADNETNEDGRVYCTEIYDDTDFYHTQLRELIEYKTNTSANATDMAKQFVELQKLRRKMKKTVDTRASKGRKIRFAVHNKLVNFMAPNDPGLWTDESKTELYRSLFGAGAQ